jgi:hypothetical protein
MICWRENEEANVVKDVEAAEGFRDVLEGDVGESLLGFAVGAGFEAFVKGVHADAGRDRLDRRRLGDLVRRRGIVRGENADVLRDLLDERRRGNFVRGREFARRAFGVAIGQEFLDPHRNSRSRAMEGAAT